MFQKKAESIAKYVGRLRSAASTCNYGNHLQRALRDQFVVGLLETEDQQDLMRQDRTLEQCIQTAAAIEAARDQVKKMQEIQQQGRPSSEVHSADVHAMKSHSSSHKYKHKKDRPTPTSGATSKDFYKDSHHSKDGGYKCYSCGKGNHKRSECRFKNAVCKKCSKKGHIAIVCRQRSVHAVDDANESFSECSTDLYTLNVHTVTDHSQISVPLQMQGQSVSMQLDTGCAVTIVPKSFYDKYCTNVELQSTDIVLNTYSGEKLYPLGKVDVDIVYENSSYSSLPLIVTQEGTTPLFGRNWLKVIKLNWRNLPGVNYIKPSVASTSNTLPDIAEKSVDEVLHRFGTLFDNELGCYKVLQLL